MYTNKVNDGVQIEASLNYYICKIKTVNLDMFKK